MLEHSAPVGMLTPAPALMRHESFGVVEAAVAADVALHCGPRSSALAVVAILAAGSGGGKRLAAPSTFVLTWAISFPMTNMCAVVDWGRLRQPRG